MVAVVVVFVLVAAGLGVLLVVELSELVEEEPVVDASLFVDSLPSLALVVVPFEDERESVMYQPLPLKTIPTGWNTLRRLPPHWSQVVRGGSEKLWRFSTTSLQEVQV